MRLTCGNRMVDTSTTGGHEVRRHVPLTVDATALGGVGDGGLTRMHALARLARRVAVREGWSDAEMVRRANRAGHELSKSRWSQMMKNVTFFGGDHIDMLVDALGEPPDVVVTALLQSIGYNMPKQPRFTLEDAIKYDEVISYDDKANLLALVRSMRRQAKLRAELNAERAVEDEPGRLDLPIDNDAGHTQQVGDTPASPTNVRRTGRRKRGDADAADPEHTEVQAVEGLGGEVAGVDGSVREAAADFGEGDRT